MKKKELFLDISRIKWNKIEDIYEQLTYLSNYFQKANKYMIVAPTKTIDIFPDIYQYVIGWKSQIQVVYGVKLIVNYQGKRYIQICLAKRKAGIDNIYRLMSIGSGEVEYCELKSHSEGIMFLYDMNENAGYIEENVLMQQRLVFCGDEILDLEFETEIEELISEVDFHNIKVLPDRADLVNLCRYEKYIIGYCLERLSNIEQQVVKELGGLIYFKAEKLLLLEKKEMEEKGLAAQYMLLKTISDFSREKGAIVQFGRSEKKRFMLKLLGITCEDNREIICSLKSLNLSKEIEDRLSDCNVVNEYPTFGLTLEKTIYVEALRYLESMFPEYKLIELDGYKGEKLFAVITKTDIIPLKKEKYLIEDMKFDVSYFESAQMTEHFNILSICQQ